MSILQNIKSPEDLEALSLPDLLKLSEEIRHFIINSLSKTGGHLGPNLGVVELTIALHKVFNTPKDKLIWDIGHQGYVHKIITGRRDKFSTLRQKDGLSGFAKIEESEYDHFGAGHSSTAISVATGIAFANSLKGNFADTIIPIIGDASIVSGMALEALNHLGSLKLPNVVVVLNDNNKSILDSVGALSNYFTKLTSSYSYSYIREKTKVIINNIPFGLGKFIKDFEKSFRNQLSSDNFFEDLGFFYIGPIDGHNLSSLITVLNNIKENKHKTKPILLHVITKKGKGFKPAEDAHDNYHGIGQFCAESGKILAFPEASKTATYLFSQEIIEQFNEDERMIAITAGTVSGVGLLECMQKYPERVIDVGIAEQHAVTFAAGLSISGFKPYVCLYSTFAQRAYDQVVHDVCLQSLPVRFILDRFGFVGPDGATHHGLLNYSMYLPLPNIIYMCASNQEDFLAMLRLMKNINDKPSFLQFSKTNLPTKSCLYESIKHTRYSLKATPKNNDLLQVNCSSILKLGDSKVAVLAVGEQIQDIIHVSNKLLIEEGIDITIIDLRVLKPLDKKTINEIAMNHSDIFVVEEGYSGIIFSEVHRLIKNTSKKSDYAIRNKVNMHSICIKDEYFEHATREEQKILAAIDKESLYNEIKTCVCSKKNS